jgi:signal transduction histidine kinase
MRIPFADRLAGRRPRLSPRTIRLRLTLVYGVLFLASGAVLLTATYFLAAHQYSGKFFLDTGNAGAVKVVVTRKAGQVVGVGVTGPATVSPAVGIPFPILSAPSKQTVVAAASKQADAVRGQLLVDSGIALGAMALLSIWLGWIVAGRVLRPLRTITSTAREITASNLHRRLALAGPDDEVTQLGNTIDDLLARLESSFEAQRQFVANASHELRTPLTFERTLVEVALADPGADAASLRAVCEQVVAAGEQQERLIDALLTLSRSQRGLDRREPVDLAAVAAAGVQAAAHDGLTVESKLGPARTSGDPRLVERLVANLVTNAIRHNVPGGRLEVSTETRAGRAVLTTANTGPIVPAARLERLFEPFERLDGARANGTDGFGLGLSIVQAIATAHGAPIVARPRPGGGLFVEVSFPAEAPARA